MALEKQMHAAKLLLAFSFLVLVIFYRTATAQEAHPKDCGSCRVWIPYGHTCRPKNNVDNAPPYNTAFIGTVIDVKPDNSISCHKVIRVKVFRSTSSSLPSTIDIDTGGCMYWDGKIGESINATVLSESMQAGTYSASGYCSGP
jgi:hypothetical protein